MSQVVAKEEWDRLNQGYDPYAISRGARDEHEVDITCPQSRTEVVNSKRLLERFAEDIRWCPKWRKWLWFSGQKWELDHGERIEGLAKQVAKDIWGEAGEVADHCNALDMKEIVAFARNTSSARGIQNMVSLARSDERVIIQPDEIDADPRLFNVQNGTIDLRTGKLRPHRREDLLMQICPTVYKPDATCPLWENTVNAIFAGRAELITYIQRLCGYWLTGLVRDHVLPIWNGAGANGKTLMLTAISSTLGDDYVFKAPSDLLLSKQDAHPTELAALFRKRLVFCVEVENGRRFAEARMKELTGDDKVTARRMREDFWTFSPTHKLCLACNDLPRVRGIDNSTWRRLQRIPFDVTFWDGDKGQSGPPELKQDKALPEKLAKERDGILAWMVRGCLEWQAKGLNAPEAVLIATNQYRADSDLLSQFIAECCTTTPGAVAEATALYTAFCEWCERNSERPTKRKEFAKQLDDKQFPNERLTTGPHKGRFIRLGIGLLADSELPE